MGLWPAPVPEGPCCRAWLWRRLFSHPPLHLSCFAALAAGDEFRAILSEFVTIPQEHLEAVARQKAPEPIAV